MRPSDNVDNPILMDTANRLSSLSIIVDDFDLDMKASNSGKEAKLSPDPESLPHQPSAKPYTRQSSDASIKKILEEKEHRRHEFWKLLDEHSEVVENLKKIEQLEACKPPEAPVSS